MNIPTITVEQMTEVDRRMIEVYNIELIQMMENAGRNLADLAQRMTFSQPDSAILVMCGAGNNGGGGLVAARHLINRGLQIAVHLTSDESKLKDIPRHQWSILKNMGVQSLEEPKIDSYDLIIDAMIGYGLMGPPRGDLSRWIEMINASQTPILSLDVPSGLDASTGIPYHPCTHAQATLTLALPKTGLMTPEAKPYVGKLYLADISVPDQLFTSMGLSVGPIFRENPILRIE